MLLTNEKRISTKGVRQPTGRYHSVITYLDQEEIEQVLNHYRQYIDSALYILHDRDTKYTDTDFILLDKKLDEIAIKIKAVDEQIDKTEDTMQCKVLSMNRGRLLKKVLDLEERKREMIADRAALKQPHWHILLRFYNAHTESAVLKYFDRFRFHICEQNDDGSVTIKYKNSFNEMVDSVGVMVDYLTHECEADKARYSKNEVYQFGRGWECFSGVNTRADEAMQIVDQINMGVPLRQIANIYGTHFIYHYKAFREFAQDVHRQEMRAQEYLDFAERCFELGTNEFESTDGAKMKLDLAKYNRAVEIVTGYEQSFELLYQGVNNETNSNDD